MIHILNQLRQQQSTVSDPILAISGLQFYVNKTSIDATATTEGNDVDVWTDLSSNGFNLTGTGTAAPELHITAGGDRQVTFDGTEDWMTLSSNTQLNFIPQTDAFSIVFKLGDNVTSSGLFGYIVAKAITSTGSRQYAINKNSSDVYATYLGGTLLTTGQTVAANDLIILTVPASTTGAVFRKNGVNTNTGMNIGTGTNTVAMQVGARDASGSPTNFFDGDIQMIAIFNKVLDSTEISNIEAVYN